MAPNDNPRPRRGSRRFAIIAALILVIVLIVFVGYNSFYVTQGS